MPISVDKLISICVQLAREGCQTVKEYYFRKQIKKYNKSPNDPVTEADFKIQTMIIKGLRMFFPNLRVVGEEQTEFEGEIEFNYKTLEEHFLPKNLTFNKQYSEEEICVWIDPIDCTKGFINDHVEDVTVLIGISLNKTAEIGIVGMPFKEIDEKAVYKPSVMFGVASHKSAYEYWFDEKEKKGDWVQVFVPKSQEGKKRIVVSSTRPESLEAQVIKELNGVKEIAGGAGQKVMMTVRNEVEMMIYMKSPTKKWDSCAPEAIARALGGYLFTPFGDELKYEYEDKNAANKDGFFCTFDKNLFEETIEVCKKYA